ncbi:MAG TPA: type IX secretion system membrane protein PorP/SprF [Flavobacteriaceae bacterium]|nr:type IX secretion system membrane protein PorP/SprF [Flavobacteriaceae bacterium]HEX5742662.1 type IX secretion system membrane protein PorP/SprF [Flavobacteriaceae bacterium]
MKAYKFKLNKSLKYFIVLIVGLASQNGFAQQDPNFSLYQYNMSIVNPAYAGTTDQLELNLNFRKQWVGIEGSPQTQALNISSPINDRVGLGLTLVNDKVFVLKETDIYADFSYKLPISIDTDLFLGIKAGGSLINIDLISLGINDPLFSEDVSKFNPNFGMGAYLKGEKYFVNLSVPGLLSSKRYEKEGVLVTKAADKAHFYIGSGYQFSLSESIDFTPSFLCKIVTGAPTSIDITGMMSIHKKTELGISYRLDESISAIAMFNYIDWLQFGYSYEHSTSSIGDYSNGSHELILKLLFLKK